MAKKPLPTPEQLRQLLRYEPDTGKLYWRERKESPRWSTRWAGKQAFTFTGKRGYKCGNVIGKQLTAHRVAWAIFYKKWPESTIDHINGDRTDNRISNLRDVSQRENSLNVAKGERNTSGAVGVYRSFNGSQWRACITIDGRQKSLGVFKSFYDASLARKVAERVLGYHPNHGR